MSIVGPSLPRKCFFVHGKGQVEIDTISNKSLSINYEANSYDAATADAGIPNINAIEYSSMLPPSVSFLGEIPSLPFGAVLALIRAQFNGGKGERLTAVLQVVEVLHRAKPTLSYERQGYFLLEYGGHATCPKARSILLAEILSMFRRRGWGTFLCLTKKDQNTICRRKPSPTALLVESESSLSAFRICYSIEESFICQKSHGTVLCALCICEWEQMVLL